MTEAEWLEISMEKATNAFFDEIEKDDKDMAALLAVNQEKLGAAMAVFAATLYTSLKDGK